jgi:hypothetical protein
MYQHAGVFRIHLESMLDAEYVLPAVILEHACFYQAIED